MGDYHNAVVTFKCEVASKAIMSLEVVLSRFPVGSSASIIFVSIAKGAPYLVGAERVQAFH
jgi:hypothetical protein